MRGLDLFSGIGGISLALGDYVRTVGYVEIDKYAQSVLLSRMVEGRIEAAPIFRDITRLDGRKLRGSVDIIFGGFPCQDLSVAGHGKGLEGKRSGLFFEVVRLVEEIQPRFIFLENVPAIRTRGLSEVVNALTKIGYDCRWTCLSASDVGALHKRERWFLLAHPKRVELREQSRGWSWENGESTTFIGNNGPEKHLAHSESERVQRLWTSREQDSYSHGQEGIPLCESKILGASSWDVEPTVCRVVNGLPDRAHRIKCLGNSIVPLQVKAAFEKVIGKI